MFDTTVLGSALSDSVACDSLVADVPDGDLLTDEDLAWLAGAGSRERIGPDISAMPVSFLGAFLADVELGDLGGAEVVRVAQAHARAVAHHQAGLLEAMAAVVERYEEARADRRVGLDPDPAGVATIVATGIGPDRASAIMSRLTRIAQHLKTAGEERTLDRLAPACRHDHVIRHRYDWRHRRDSDGNHTWYSPLGMPPHPTPTRMTASDQYEPPNRR